MDKWTAMEAYPYAAGLFDGEGTVSVNKKLSVSIAISGNYLPMHEWLVDHFGGSFTSGGPPHLAGEVLSDGRIVQTDSKKEWKWRLNGQEALNFLGNIERFLIEKKEQVQLVLSNRTLWPDRPVRLTEEVRTRRASIRETLKQIRIDNGGLVASE